MRHSSSVINTDLSCAFGRVRLGVEDARTRRLRRHGRLFLSHTATNVRALGRLLRRQPGPADQYVHRLGRKARAGQEGHGIIVLAPFESRFLN